MRKIIAVLVVFALVVGAAFAESSISGTLEVRGLLLNGTPEVDNWQPTSQGEISDGYLQFSGANDEGTFGGLVRIKGLGSHNHSVAAGLDAAGGSTGYNGASIHRAFAWWKPIEQLEIFFGQDPDGKFAPYNPWSFFNGSEGYSHPNADWGKWRAAMAFTNWDTFGLAFTLKPIDGLAIDLVVPVGDGQINYASPLELRTIYGGRLQLTASFAIPEVGTVYFGLKGTENVFLDKPRTLGAIGAAFSLSAIEGLNLLVGFSTVIPGEVSDQPVHLALQAGYASGDFGIKARVRYTLNGRGGFGAYVKDANDFAIDILPYFDLGILTAYLNIGIASEKATATGDPVTTLVINPYVRIGMGSGSIRAGLIIRDPDIDTDKNLVVQVPVVFGVSF